MVRHLFSGGRRKRVLVVRFSATLVTAGFLAATAIPAGATRAQIGHVIVSLDASFSPRRLPRHRPAPVSISVSGLLSTDDGSPLPRLRGIELALASGSSRLDTLGLPRCPRRRLLGATERQALQRCPGALVGRGSLSAEVEIPGQARVFGARLGVPV